MSEVPSSRIQEASAGPSLDPEGRLYPYAVVAILVLASTLAFMDRTLLSLVVDPVKRDLRLSETQLSLLAGFAFALFYSVVGLPFGRLADTWNRRWLMIWGVAGWSLATAACGMTHGFGDLFLARALVGVGEAALAPAAVSLIANYFPSNRLGMAMSLLAVGITLGNGAAISLSGLIVHWSETTSLGAFGGLGPITGWRLAFLAVAALGLPVVLLMSAIREPRREAEGEASVAPPMSEVFAHMRRFRAAYVGVFVGYPLVIVMSLAQLFWGPSYFLRVHHFTISQYGALYGVLMGIGGTAGLLGGGLWSDRLWRQGRLDAPMRVIWISVLVQAPLLIGAYLASDRVVAMTLFGLSIVVLCVNGGLQNATLRLLTPERMRGRVVALYIIVANLVGAGLAPLLTAWMTERLFGGPSGVGRSLAALTVLSLGPAAFVLARSLRAVRAAVIEQASGDDVRQVR